MSSKKDIDNTNDKNQCHGYQEWYWIGRTSYPIRVNYKNDKEIGYEEDTWNGSTNFYIR